MKSITSPLNLKNKISATNINWDIIPILDIFVIALFLSLVGSEYISAPGLSINLPEGGKSVVQTEPITAILTVNHDNMLFFGGAIYGSSEIGDALSAYLDTNKPKDATLLVKIGKNVSINGLFLICEIAKESGFTKLHIAGNENMELKTEITSKDLLSYEL